MVVMTGEETDDTEDETIGSQENTIPEAIGNFSYEDSTENIAKNFNLAKSTVNRYEKSRGWYYRIEGKPFLLTLLGYFLVVAVSVGLSSLTDIPETQRNEIMAALFILLLATAGILWAFKKVAGNRAKKQNITAEDAIYYELSQAIKNYKAGRLGDVRSNLRNAHNLFQGGDVHPFDLKFNNELGVYLSDFNEDQSERFISNTFPSVAVPILKYLHTIDDVTSDGFQYQTEVTSDDYSYSPIGMTKSYISDKFENRIVRISAPFILISPIVIAVGVYIDELLAQFIFFGFIAVMQIYFNIKS